LIFWLLKQPEGNAAHGEISGAVREGASAYLRRSTTTIAMVAVVPFILIGVYNKLGWGTPRVLVGATCRPLRLIGMNVAVRYELTHCWKAARDDSSPRSTLRSAPAPVTGLLGSGSV